MTKEEILLLFDPDPRRAEDRINHLIRKKMVSFFAWNRCRDDEDLAQEVYVRVVRNLNKGTKIEPEKLEAYFYGVAKILLLEYQRGEWRKAETPLDDALDLCSGPSSPEHNLHLKRCLEHLDPAEFELLEHYYASRNRSDKKELAIRMGLSASGLGVKVHRIKENLRKCLGFVERPNLKVE